MSKLVSLTPGFRPVAAMPVAQNRFNGFLHLDKPLKRLACCATYTTPLKRGVNQKHPMNTHHCNIS